MISLIQESQGRFTEARAEVQKLVTQFAEIAGKKESAQSLEALIADSSTDPLLQGLIRGLIKKSLSATKDSNISASTLEKLTDEAVIKEIFTSDVLKQVKASAATLIQHAGVDDKSIVLDGKELQMAVTRAYLASPKVRSHLLQGQINEDIRKRGPIIKMLAPLAAGIMGIELKWEKVRKTPQGQEAEQWVMDQVVMPLAEGRITPEEAKIRQKEAATRVQAALKKK